MVMDSVSRIADELSLPKRGVEAVTRLLDEGNTVPFIARYRKEVTGSLDEVQIRAIEDRKTYLSDLSDRREAIKASIGEQGRLTPELSRALDACATKVALEDLYLPYKKKRRTRATVARERGLEPLADVILEQPNGGSPVSEAGRYVDPGSEVPDVETALGGARDIVAERVAETARVRAWLRDEVGKRGVLVSKKSRKAGDGPTKFEQYYDFSEPVARVPSHRYLAMARGEREGVLSVSMATDEEPAVRRILGMLDGRRASPFFQQLEDAVRDSMKRLLLPAVERELRSQLKLKSDGDAIEVFGQNLGNLLLAAPLGGKAVLGIDPGLRTGCKCAALDATGRILEHTTVYLTAGSGKLEAAKDTLARLIRSHQPFAVAVGNGTGGRETESFVKAVVKEAGADTIVVSVNEAGASVYSASDVAREEFPDLDLTVRGAISIGRRLQDPLAELVKVEPKAIGVGQYQHDVHQPTLQTKLDQVVESCVNRVGVEVNTASAQLLAYVAGIGPNLAKKIVQHRTTQGRFGSRDALKKVSGLGAKTYEQAAGFLRVSASENPLDNSAVHPERYGVVAQMARDLGVALAALVGDGSKVTQIEPARYVSGDLGEPTLKDILSELRKPGRDPRDQFEAPAFRDDVNAIGDLRQNMVLQGIVTNVTDFGAFVDIGVHQDGLVHISQLADRFVKHPSDVVSAGQRLEVRVLDIDLARKRISLSAKKGAAPQSGGPPSRGATPNRSGQPRKGGDQGAPGTRKQGKGGARKPKESFGHNPFASLKKGN